MGKRRADKPPPDSIGEHRINRLGLTKKPTARKFSRALLKSLCQSSHRPLASRSLTLLTFALADAFRIRGIGWHLRGWLESLRDGIAFHAVWDKKQPGTFDFLSRTFGFEILKS